MPFPSPGKMCKKNMIPHIYTSAILFQLSRGGLNVNVYLECQHADLFLVLGVLFACLFNF